MDRLKDRCSYVLDGMVTRAGSPRPSGPPPPSPRSFRRTRRRPWPGPRATCWRRCGRAAAPWLHRGGPQRPRAAGRLQLRQGQAGRRGRRRRGPAAEDERAGGAGGPGVGRPVQRRDRGDVRRRGLPEAAVQRRDPGPAAGRLDVQAVHAVRGAGERRLAVLHLERPQPADVRQAGRLGHLHRAELRQRVVRHDHLAAGDRRLGQHRLRRRQPDDRLGEGRSTRRGGPASRTTSRSTTG